MILKFRHVLCLTLPALAFASCGIVGKVPKYRVSDGIYTHRVNGFKQKVYVEGTDDSLVMTLVKDKTIVGFSEMQSLSKSRLDVDLLITPFKYRPAVKELPRQLNTSFNGNVFIGYRVDHFLIESKKKTIGRRHSILHTALTLGAFGGIGSTAVNPWTTGYLTTDEYDGLVISRGFAILVGFNSFTGGLAAGFDHLSGRDKKIWIYQDRPWLGVVLGLNLN